VLWVSGPDDKCQQRSRTTARPDQAVLVGVHDSLHPVPQPELIQHPADVCLDCGLGQEELGGDLGVRQARGDLDEDLPFAGGLNRLARERGMNLSVKRQQLRRSIAGMPESPPEQIEVAHAETVVRPLLIQHHVHALEH
jgi:hypothetical protein